MKVLVTGVCGFIGSHLAEGLLAEGFDVIGVDSYLDYYPRHFKENNIKELINSPGFTFIEANLFDLDLAPIVDQVDGVFHQAAIAGVRASWGAKFHEYVNNNIQATQLLLEACKEKDLKRFVYASSSSVYGSAEELPIKESSPTNPVSPYGVSKLAAEHLTSLYSSGYGVPGVSLRYFTVYGPRQRPDMAFHKFIKAIIQGDTIEVYGTGEQTRDFTFIDDVIDANINVFKDGRDGEVYNIGGGSRISVLDAIELIEDIVGKKAELKFIEPQRGDAKHTFSDISKAKNHFDYSPCHTIGEGLQEHYEYIMKNLALYV